MSDIRFMCPHCAQSIEAPEDMRGQILDCPNCGKPLQVHELTSPFPAGGHPASASLPETKSGVLIAAAICLGIGILLMFLSLLTAFIFGPLFFASLVLSIVAIAQKRVLGGVLMLLATLIIPAVIGIPLMAYRAATTTETISQAFDQAAADYQREAATAFMNTVQSQDVSIVKRTRDFPGLQVSGARYYREANFFAYSRIEFTVRNQTGTAISRIFCHGRLSSPGRTIPWADEEFNVAIPGGLEPGESKLISLRPPQNGPYGHAELKDRTDLVMEISVLDAEDASGQRLAR